MLVHRPSRVLLAAKQSLKVVGEWVELGRQPRPRKTNGTFYLLLVLPSSESSDVRSTQCAATTGNRGLVRERHMYVCVRVYMCVYVCMYVYVVRGMQGK